MDEIDYYGITESQGGADDAGDEEFFGEGILDAERSPEELAQAILFDLQRLVETYGIDSAELERLVELLKETFTIVESVPRLREKCSALKEDRDILHDEWLKEKEKYRKRTEERTEYELLLEADNRKLKEAVQQLKQEKVEADSRLETVKRQYDDQRELVDAEGKKQQDEYRKLWGIIQVYQEKYEQIGAVERQATIKKLKQGHRYLSRKVKMSSLDETRPHLKSPLEGSLTPKSTPVDTPTGEFPLAFQIPLSNQASGGRSAQEELTEEGKGAGGRAMESSVEVTPVEVVPVPGKPTRGVRKVKAEEGDLQEFIKSDEFDLSDVSERELSLSFHSEGEIDESWGPPSLAQVGPESLEGGDTKPGVSLADELLATDPNYLANTEMARLLTDLQKIQQEKEEVVREKLSFLEEIEALKKVNASLEEDVHLLNEKEDRLKEELARAKDSNVNIIVDDDLSETGMLSYCCTKEELFSKLRELMEYKTRCIELKEELSRLKKKDLLQGDQEEGSTKKSSWFWTFFKRTPKKEKPAVGTPPRVRVATIARVGQEDYDKWLKKSSIKVDNFISITGWLLGPSATKVLRLLPSIIGKITLSIYEVERVDCAAIALISAENAGPQKPVRQKKELIPTAGWTQGGIRDKYRSHAAPCVVELWVASTARQETKVEVVSVFARAGQHVLHQFKVSLDHIQCMRAIPGKVPLAYTPFKTATLPGAELPMEETTTMWLVSQQGVIHLHEVGPVPFQKRNTILLDNYLGAFCIQYVNEMVLIGQQKSHVAVFRKREDGLWNIDCSRYIKLPEAIGEQDVHSILPVGEQIWVGAGHWITVLDNDTLTPKGNITVTLPPKMETRFKTGDMVAVGNTVVVAQRRGSHLVLCCVDTADVIGSIDVTDLCSIYEQDKGHLKEVVVVSSLSADRNCIYIGTKSGTVVCFSVATLREFLESKKVHSPKERDMAHPIDNALVEPVTPKSAIRDTVEARCSGVSLNGHAKAAKALLHAVLPVRKKEEEDSKPTPSADDNPGPSNPLLTKRRKQTPKQFCELIISVGIGHVDFSSVGQGLFNVVTPRHQASKTELLVWGQPEE